MAAAAQWLLSSSNWEEAAASEGGRAQVTAMDQKLLLSTKSSRMGGLG
jgi:hypothetical protein